MNDDKIVDIGILIIIFTIIILNATQVINIPWCVFYIPILALLGIGIILAIAMSIVFVIVIITEMLKEKKEK